MSATTTVSILSRVLLTSDKPFLLFVTYGSLLAAYATFEAGRETLRFFDDPDSFITSTPASPYNATCVGGPSLKQSNQTSEVGNRTPWNEPRTDVRLSLLLRSSPCPWV